MELAHNFDQKNWFDFFTERSFLEDLLGWHISLTDWYFIPSFDIEPANLLQWKFNSLVVFFFKKKYEWRIVGRTYNEILTEASVESRTFFENWCKRTIRMTLNLLIVKRNKLFEKNFNCKKIWKEKLVN